MPTWSATPWPTRSLGAAGLGDIGEHYPDTDPQWEGLDSTRLLAEVVDRVQRSGWRAVNCDVIIHAQEPKLGPHKPAIRANLARLLGVEPRGRERQGQDRRARRADRPGRGDRLRGRRAARRVDRLIRELSGCRADGRHRF